jgi:hypothetical protein
MDVEGDYFWCRCKDINGLRVFKGPFMTFVGGDSDNKKLLYFSIKQFLFANFGVEMILDKLTVSKSTKFTTHKIENK